MKPYYQDDYVTIYHADCREALTELPDNSVDLVLTDPPYGRGTAKNGIVGYSVLAQVKDYGPASWDLQPFSHEQFDAICRVSRNQIIFGANYFCDILPSSPCWLVWDKRAGHKSNDFADCELIWTSFKTPARLYSYLWQGMLQQDMKNKEVRLHPTQKPLALIKRILADYSKPGDIICDPFLGSGTTAFSSKQLGRYCVAFEIEERYCEIAAKRCSQAVFNIVTDNGKKCYICGSPVKGRADAIFCSDKCRQKAYRERAKNSPVEIRREVYA